LKTILISTIFHEVTNRFTDLMFRQIWCGTRKCDTEPQDPGNDLEIFLLGGLVLVLWKTEDIGDTTKIKGLVLLYGDQSRILSECRVSHPHE
jgi:hypothetical protein